MAKKENKKLQASLNALNRGEIGEIWGKNWRNLFQQVDSSTAVFFRIAFGMVLLWEVVRYFQHGWIEKYWIAPQYHFTYFGFDWLSPLPGDGMYMLFFFMGVLAICIILGLAYRPAIILFFLSFTYMFLLEQARYMNHFYLVSLISFVMIFLPLNRSASLDAKIRPSIVSSTVPAWVLWMIRFMIGVPYFFGGVAKLGSDWIHGEPLRMWLAMRSDMPVLGDLFLNDGVVMFMAWSGLLLDLFIVPALLFKRTRLIGFVAILSFHLLNSQIFWIGIFPWFMILGTTVYFRPDWVRNVVNWLASKVGFLSWMRWPLRLGAPETLLAPAKLEGKHKLAVGLLVFWVSFHCLVPLRHFLYPGNANWTEEGHRWAWHMKLRDKDGSTQFIVVNLDTGDVTEIFWEDYLEYWQYDKMSRRPYMIWQFAKFLKDDFAAQGSPNVEVHVNSVCSLNGREYQSMIDPGVDLASQPRPFLKSDSWILPLEIPLDQRREGWEY